MASCKKKLLNWYEETKPLIPLKVAVFLFYGGVFSLLPFLSVHMQSLGLSIQQTAVVYAVLLLISFAGSPIAGYLTDKTGHFKLVLSVLLITTAVLHTCLLFIPSSSIRTEKADIKFSCTPTGAYLLMDSCKFPKHSCPINFEENGTTFSIKSCKFSCWPDEPTSPKPRNETAKLCFGYRQYQRCMDFEESLIDASNFTLVNYPVIYEAYFTCAYRIHTVILNDNQFGDMSCPARKLLCRLDCGVHLISEQNEVASCPKQVGDPNVTFYTYFVLRLLCILTLSASYPLLESAILIQSKKFNGEYGKQRVWSNVAGAVFTPLAGIFVDLLNHQRSGPSSYIPAFILFDVLLLMTIFVVIYSLDINVQSYSKLKIRDLKRLFHTWSVVLLYIAVFFLGAIWGFLETFLFVFLLDIGSSKFLLGLSRTVGSLICIPTMFFADTIMNRIGRVNLLIMAFICYSIQLFCYSVIVNPWWAIPLEILKFFTSCLKLASAVTLANSLAPKRLTTTMQAILRCINYEIGSGVGNIVGGSIAASLGLRNSFKALGYTSCALGIAYAFGHFLLGSKKTPCYTAPEKAAMETIADGDLPNSETSV
uniref:Major facilitator superfamily associated domain-containing protein n=1 Tax=Strigamia maritima TaxID=126957 RepID=T1IJS1_STRMM